MRAGPENNGREVSRLLASADGHDGDGWIPACELTDFLLDFSFAARETVKAHQESCG